MTSLAYGRCGLSMCGHSVLNYSLIRDQINLGIFRYHTWTTLLLLVKCLLRILCSSKNLFGFISGVDQVFLLGSKLGERLLQTDIGRFSTLRRPWELVCRPQLYLMALTWSKIFTINCYGHDVLLACKVSQGRLMNAKLKFWNALLAKYLLIIYHIEISFSIPTQFYWN